jgi:hypothetical protein
MNKIKTIEIKPEVTVEIKDCKVCGQGKIYKFLWDKNRKSAIFLRCKCV